MASGQIDPARLDGDALRQWYLRSPADIERERQEAAAQAYDTFFTRTSEDDPTHSASGDPAAAGARPDDEDASHRPRQLAAPQGASASDAKYELVSAPLFQDYWSGVSCASCHRYGFGAGGR